MRGGALYPQMGVECHPPIKGGTVPPPPLQIFLLGIECHSLPMKFFPDNQFLDFATQSAISRSGRGRFSRLICLVVPFKIHNARFPGVRLSNLYGKQTSKPLSRSCSMQLFSVLVINQCLPGPVFAPAGHLAPARNTGPGPGGAAVPADFKDPGPSGASPRLNLGAPPQVGPRPRLI